MEKVLIKKVKDLLNLTLEGKVTPKTYTYTEITYKDIELYYNILSNEMIIMIKGNRYNLEYTPRELSTLFQQVANCLVDKDREVEKNLLEQQLTTIIENLKKEESINFKYER